MIQSIQQFLNGKKTHIGMILSGTLGLCLSMGWIDVKTAAAIGSILVPLTGISMRVAVKKSGQQ